MSNSHGVFHWNELMTPDAEKAKAFYTETLGWTYDEMPMPDGNIYFIAKSGDIPVAGIFDTNKDANFAGMPETWMGYIAVDDVQARVAKAVANGGEMQGDYQTMDGIGTVAMVKQPGGAMIGWMTPEE